MTAGELAILPFEVYDLTAEYAEQVEPLVSALMDKCVELGMPLLIIAAVEQDAEGGFTSCMSSQFESPERTPIPIMAAKARGEGDRVAGWALYTLHGLRAAHAAGLSQADDETEGDSHGV